MRLKKGMGLAAVAGTAMLNGGVVQAAYEVQTASVAVSYESPNTEVYLLDIPAHNSFLHGPMQSVSYRAGFNGGTSSGSITWTLTNNSGGPVTNQQAQVMIPQLLEVASTGDDLVNSSTSVFSPSFDLAASDSYHYELTTLPTAYSGQAGVTTPSVLDTFGNSSINTLRLTTSMTADSAPDPATLDRSAVDDQISGTYDLTMVYKYDSNAAPTAPTVALGSSTFGNFDGIETQWYRFFYPGGPLTIDTLGSSVDSDGSNDTMIALYGGSPTGSVLVSSNDNGAGFTGGNALLSQMHFNTGELTPGVYFIAVSPDGTAYEATDYNANPFDADAATGQYRLNINNPVPEPAGALIVAAGLGIFSLRRRRL